MSQFGLSKYCSKQESIPVGCVPPACQRVLVDATRCQYQWDLGYPPPWTYPLPPGRDIGPGIRTPHCGQTDTSENITV